MDPHAANWQQCLEVAARSDIGLRRANNQDSFAVVLAGSQEQWEQRGHLFVVADGMGAHAAGELASKLATDSVPLTYHKLLDRPPHEALCQAVCDANAQIHSRGMASDDFRGMGTTISALVLLPDKAFVAHVGDSRVYRLRARQIEQLTFDHSLVWELRAAGQIAPGDAPNYIPKNIITRSLGPNPEVQVDLEGPLALEPGDIFLLCSDGLSGQVSDPELGKILSVLPPEEAVRTLIDLANLRGGPDNITVIVVRVKERPDTGAITPVAPRVRHTPSMAEWAVWGVAAAFALIALGGAVARYPIVALCSLAGAVVSAVVALVMRRGPMAGGEPELRPLGKGPYGRWDCTPDLALVTELARVCQQLREAASGADWKIHWTAFSKYDSRAAAAAREGRYGEAAGDYCRAITFLMDQLRHQPRPSGTDGTSIVL
jgi:protein phosphatase